MTSPRNALLLVGSPKTKTSASGYLGDYLMERLEERHVKTTRLRLSTCEQSEPNRRQLLQAIQAADLIVIAAPLYVDSLPTGVIRFLECIADHCPKQYIENKGFAVIINCGFPEAGHNETAVAIYRQFAHQMNLQWRGALAMGMGGRINHQMLNPHNRTFKNVKLALDLAADALVENQTISDKAIRLMARSAMPSCLYLWIIDMVWKKQANKNMVRHKLGYRPYQKNGSERNDIRMSLI